MPGQTLGSIRRWLVSTSRQTASSAADRKSTRLNSSHSQISYAVFCLKKKKNKFTSHPVLHFILNTGGVQTYISGTTAVLSGNSGNLYSSIDVRDYIVSVSRHTVFTTS